MEPDSKEFSLLFLPEEIILYIAAYLTAKDLFQGLGCTCWYLNNLILSASSFGNVANFLFLSNSVFTNLKHDEQKSLTSHILTSCTPFKGIEFEGFDSNSSLLDHIIHHACQKSSIKLLKFERYVLLSKDRYKIKVENYLYRHSKHN